MEAAQTQLEILHQKQRMMMSCLERVLAAVDNPGAKVEKSVSLNFKSVVCVRWPGKTNVFEYTFA